MMGLKGLFAIYQKWRILPQSIGMLWRIAPRETALLALLTIIEGGVLPFGVWLSKQVIDAVVAVSQQSPTTLSLWQWVALWLLTLVLGWLFTPWSTLLSGNLGDKLGAHINLSLIRKANAIPELTPFEHESFYNNLQLLKAQASYRPMYLISSSLNAMSQLVTCTGLLWILSGLSWWLPLLIFVLSLPHGIMERHLNRLNWKTLERLSPLTRRMEYATSVALDHQLAKETRLFNTGRYLENVYATAFNSFFDHMRRYRVRQAFWPLPLILFSLTGHVAAFVWLMTQASQGLVTAGAIVLYIQALLQLQTMLLYLTYNFSHIHEHLMFFEKYFWFLNFDQEVPVSASVSDKTNFQEIHFEEVSFAYPDGHEALEGLSLKLRAGEKVAIVGENGAGKSTFVKLLTRLYRPTSGVIKVDGIDVQDLDLETWRAKFSVLFQDFGRYHFTMGENIALGDLQSDATSRLDTAARQAELSSLVNTFAQGYATQLGKQFGGTDLSGGQWQRVALARAFYRDADILILDEPSASLDPEAEYALFNRLSELSQGRLTLFITHRLSSVRLADRILVLQQGKLIEDGSHHELMKTGGLYARLYRLQASQFAQAQPGL